jgi:hypothetical protein
MRTPASSSLVKTLMNTFCSPANLFTGHYRADVKTVETPRLPTETTVASTAGMDIESALPATVWMPVRKIRKSECTLMNAVQMMW